MARLRKDSEDWFVTESDGYVVVPLRSSGSLVEGDKRINVFTFYTLSSQAPTRIEWEGKLAVLDKSTADYLVRHKYARKAEEGDFPKAPQAPAKGKASSKVDAPVESEVEEPEAEAGIEADTE